MNIFSKTKTLLKHSISAYKIPFSYLRIVAFHRLGLSPQGPRILAQLVDQDFTYFHRLYYFCMARRVSSVDWILVRGDKYQKRGWKRDLLRGLLNNFLTDIKSKVLFLGTFGGRIKLYLYKPSVNPSAVKLLAKEMKASASSIEELLNLKVRDILIGDLIYDSYLRFKPAPTLDLKDEYLDDLFDFAAKVLLGFEEVIMENSYDLYFSTYTSYIEHGIPVRLCLKYKIPVICTGVFNQVLVQPTMEFPYHKRNFYHYADWITESNKSDILKIGKLVLEKRFSGQVDPVTGYMKVSSFSDVDQTDVIAPGIEKCIVMAHDFFDSPHVYGSMLFPDFYQWLDFILKNAKDCKSHRYFVKPHPNAIKDSVHFYELFKQRYPEVTFLDASTSNKKIFNSGFHCMFTLNGTVAHEFPYAGLPAITCGASPHSAFHFCHEAKSLEELSVLIQDPNSLISHPKREDIELFAGVHSWRMYQDGMSDLFPWIHDSTKLLHLLEDNAGVRSKKIEIMNREYLNVLKL